MAVFNSIPQGSSMGQHPSYGNEDLQEGSYSRADVNSNANRKANETRARYVGEMESDLYELWQFIPEENENGGKMWKSAPRKLVASDQATLENLVKTMEAEDSVEEQWESLSPNKQALIKALVREHNQSDNRYKWSYVYIKTKTRKVKGIGNHRDVTLKMDVILLRELQHQPMSAEGSFEASSAGHAGSHSGVPNNRSGGQLTLDDMARQANHAHITSSGPGIYRAAENRGVSVNGQPPSHAQANPQVRLQGHMPAQPGPQQQGRSQVYPYTQNTMPPEANYAMTQGARFHTAQVQGMQKGQATDKYGAKVSPLPNNASPVGGGINIGVNPFASTDDEGIHPAHKASASRNNPSMQKQSGRFAAGDLPQHARKANATAPPPKVVQQDRRINRLRDDSSFMTDDESLFEEEDGYSSAASSVGSIAKGSLHREKRYMRREMSDRDRGHRTHYRKQSQKSYSRSGYTSGNVDILPSTSNHRSRESRRYGDMSRASNRPVTVHESTLDTRTPGLAELNLSANEASYRLMKMEETQRALIDKMDRLSLNLNKPESRDYVERGVTARGIEPEIRRTVLAQPVYYPEPPVYPRRPAYVPREMHPAYMASAYHPYIYEPYP
ncbi:hypothetical protein PMAA_033960 [Talaromyces marneffei ATCC 18224]|uniref:Uncharacterized protein n=1 Tax=Talaromyces marneffei (strain ATCC 18224 / CBS 334.59 / QM 7333) TaxID=441960 RepID=B6Q6B8_TALMQ|nr:hypothetical protein PMAA_033960 [Talaromyces marneffei ATCC 18224]